jgi:LacI family transcriptional regulator
MRESVPPKYKHLSAEIETRLRQGRYGAQRLPALRQLAKEYGVSVFTVSRAVQVLRDKGLIGRVDHSGCHVATDGVTRAEVWGVCLRVMPGDWQAVSGSMVRAGFETLAYRDGTCFIEPFTWDEHTSRREMAAQVRGAVAAGVRGVFLLPSRLSDAWMRQDEEFLAACAAERLPVVLLERNLRGRARDLEHDLVGVDDFDGGARCTRHLLELGRRRVAVVVASPCSSHDAMVAGYCHALRHAPRPPKPPKPAAEPRVLELPATLSRKDADRWLADQVVGLNLDGVFCYQDSVAVGLILELFSRGSAVPRDVAVVGYADMPIGNVFSLGVTTYRYPAEALVRNAVWVMRRRTEAADAPPVKVLVPGGLIVRQSTAGSSSRGN